MAIISISGKIGVGKDSVALIIKYLDSQRKGYRGTFSDWNLTSDRGLYPSTWKVKKFAYKLKQTASLLTGVPVEKFEDQEFKKQEMPDWGMTYREFLQKLGTEAIRDNLHKDVWVKALFADYTPVEFLEDQPNPILAPELPNWIITDTRFENEAEAVKAHGGILLRINGKFRTERETRFDSYLKLQGISPIEHPSETALDNYPFDYVINNDGSIEELTEKVKEFLIKFNLNG